MQIGNREFQTSGHTYVMGILNITPDSFSDGGCYNEKDQALFHVEEMLNDGMDVLDVGGESTRPGYVPLSAQEEIDRVIPVIEAVKTRFDVPVSLDTYKSAVAEAGARAGIDLVNDIWGLKSDPAMAGVIARYGLSCCLMHNRNEANYRDLLSEICTDLTETLMLADAAGIERTRIILDPGIGFGKTYTHNLEVLRRLEVLQNLNQPLLLGASRKSVIGLTLGLPTDERVEGTLVTTVLAAQAGFMFVRVHDVKENVRALAMLEAIRNGSNQN